MRRYQGIARVVCPQVEAAEAAGKCMILVNPKLGDIPSANGVMGVMGRWAAALATLTDYVTLQPM